MVYVANSNYFVANIQYIGNDKYKELVRKQQEHQYDNEAPDSPSDPDARIKIVLDREEGNVTNNHNNISDQVAVEKEIPPLPVWREELSVA